MKKIVNIILIIFILFLMIPNISLAFTYEEDTIVTVIWSVKATITPVWNGLLKKGDPAFYQISFSGKLVDTEYTSNPEKVNEVLRKYGNTKDYQKSKEIEQMLWHRQADITMYQRDGKYIANIKTEDGSYNKTIEEKTQKELEDKVGKTLWSLGADNNVEHEGVKGYKIKTDANGNELKEKFNNSVKGVVLIWVEDFNSNDNVRYPPAGGCVMYAYNESTQQMTPAYNRRTNSSKVEATKEIKLKSKYVDSNSGETWCSTIEGKYVRAQDLRNAKASDEEIKKAKEQEEAEQAAKDAAKQYNPQSSGMLTKNAEFGPSRVLVANAGGTDITDPTKDAGAYKPDDLSDTNELLTKAGVIIGIIRNIGIAVGVIGLSAIGLRYMFASITEKAEYKETMMPYLLGCILLMAGTTIIDFIYRIAITFGK